MYKLTPVLTDTDQYLAELNTSCAAEVGSSCLLEKPQLSSAFRNFVVSDFTTYNFPCLVYNFSNKVTYKWLIDYCLDADWPGHAFLCSILVILEPLLC